MRLKARERETIVNFNQAEDKAYIYTCDPKWWRHFEGLGTKHTQVHKDSDGVVCAKDYEVPKNWVKLPKPPKKVSERQREAARRTMLGIHHGKDLEMASAVNNRGKMP